MTTVPLSSEASARELLVIDHHDLAVLTAAEKLFIWRRRQLSLSGRVMGRNGPALNRTEAAARLGVELARYTRFENGQLPAEALAEALGPVVPTTGELCLIARRRSGRLLMTLERELGVSRPRFHELERAGATVMTRFWADRGFRFPPPGSPT